jgi:hypothetical protein
MKTTSLLPVFVALFTLCGCSGSGSPDDAGFDGGDLDDAWNGDGDTITDHDQEKIAWGWVTVLESGGGYIGYSAAGAYFAVEPSYPRSLPHHLDIPCQQVDQAGSCTLFVHPALLFAACDPPCDGDQECMYSGTNAFCQDLPHHWDVGTVTIDGLKTAVAMNPDDLDLYIAVNPPEDLFDQGDHVTASITGGELGPFTLSATGVADLAIASDTVELQRGMASTVSWTPADPDTRVQVLLLSGPHDPTRPTAAILCDVPDGDGSVTIDAALVDGFLNHLVVVQKFSRITRYTRDVQTPFVKEIELIVGSVKGVGLIVP